MIYKMGVTRYDSREGGKKSPTKDSKDANDKMCPSSEISALNEKFDNLVLNVNKFNKDVIKRISTLEYMIISCVDMINKSVKVNMEAIKEDQEKLRKCFQHLERELDEIDLIGCTTPNISDDDVRGIAKKLFGKLFTTNMTGIPLNDSPFNERLVAKRKLSFPATLHQATLLDVNISARRRLSNVSDAVTRKLSYTIGWKSAQIPAQDIITQGKCLCGQYIKRRLRRSGLFNRKLGLQRIRSILGTTSITVVREVFPSLMVLGDELERMHPRLYNSVARQICRSPGGEIQSSEAVPILMSAVARDLFRTDITWGKVISLFAIAGGLAVDCVKQGHPEYLPKLVEGVSEVIEDELVPWINENGGWIGLNNHVYPANNEFTAMEWTTLVVGCFVALLVIGLVARLIAVYLLPFMIFKSS